MNRVAVAAVVAGPSQVVDPFLHGLAGLEPSGSALEWLFVDDTEDAATSRRLAAFAEERGAEVIGAGSTAVSLQKSISTRRGSIRMGRLADRLVDRALARGVDAALFVEPELMLHRTTLAVLLSAGVDIVGEVAWARRPESWEDARTLQPTAWEGSGHSLVPPRFEADLRAHLAMEAEFLDQLRDPGIHRVGGISGCVLVRRRVLEDGVRFAELPNLPWSGHGHAFCVRAVACGYDLWADTSSPPIFLGDSAVATTDSFDHLRQKSVVADQRALPAVGCQLGVAR